jgi:phenylacetate-coenzyme A ligase PaaK-like adenylate-forming protein
MDQIPYARPTDPLQMAAAQWSVATLAAQTLLTRGMGAAAIAAAQRQRYATLVAHARMHSPFYRKRWRHLPTGVPALADLPVVTKQELMAAFDDWCTDRAIGARDVGRFLGTRAHIGERYRERYLVWTSSGTTGTPGVFVQDEAALAAYDALVSVQLTGSMFAACDWSAAAAQGGRAALVTADCDHFASIASWRRVAHGKPWLDMKSFAVTLPLPDIVAGLDAYRPAFIASYPTVLALLADEQNAGRLRLRPAALWAGGEALSRATHDAIEHAFGCPLINEYGASECLTIGYGCREGSLHVNSDWAILEPVDREHRPTPPGALSHTVLLTNLANSVQPIVRYDLGDRVRAATARCGCGSALPAIQVEGRCDDVVALTAGDGTIVRLVPLALTTVVEEATGVHRFQIVQRAVDCLVLRFGVAYRARAATPALRAMREYLDRQGLRNVAVLLDEREPQADARDGKLRGVIALARR